MFYSGKALKILSPLRYESDQRSSGHVATLLAMTIEGDFIFVELTLFYEFELYAVKQALVCKFQLRNNRQAHKGQRNER